MAMLLTDKETIEWVHPYTCKYLYKYRSMHVKGLERIIADNEIYIPFPQFNDPFDCNPALTVHPSSAMRKAFYGSILEKTHPGITRQEKKKLIAASNSDKKMMQPEWREQFFENYIRKFGLYCLTEMPDDLLMWAHYADSHRGICLQFKSDTISTFF